MRMRHIGVSNFDVEQLRRIQAIAPVETLQPPSLVAREIEDEILPFAEAEGIGVIVYSPMASGLLTGKMTLERIESLPDDYGPLYHRLLHGHARPTQRFVRDVVDAVLCGLRRADSIRTASSSQ